MMKIYNILFLALALSFSTGVIIAQVDATETVADAAADGPIMTFESKIVDYGAIVQHGDPLRIAKFTNTGTKPLVIKNARGSCGCTVPEWPKEPIMPGETADIKVRYDTKRVGRINKTVTITTNQIGDPIVLKVIGQISKEEVQQESVPAPKNGLIKSNN